MLRRNWTLSCLEEELAMLGYRMTLELKLLEEFMNSWKQRAEKWSSEWIKSTQTGKTRKVAFSITQTTAWHLLQEWKGLKIHEKGKNLYSARATCFSCSMELCWSNILAVFASGELHCTFCHSSFQNKWVHPDIQDMQEISKLDSSAQENVPRLPFSEIWGRNWKVCHGGGGNPWKYALIGRESCKSEEPGFSVCLAFPAELNSVTSVCCMVYCIHKHDVQEIKFIALNCCEGVMTALPADTVGTLYALGSLPDSLDLLCSYLGKYNPLLYGRRLTLKAVVCSAMKPKSRSVFWHKGLLCPWKIILESYIHVLFPPQNQK